MPRNPRHITFLICASVAATSLVALGLLFRARVASVPPDFQFQSQLSTKQAELFYAKATHELHQAYWRGIYGNLRNFQFKYAWRRFSNGQGHLAGVLTDSNSNVLACVTFKDGNAF